MIPFEGFIFPKCIQADPGFFWKLFLRHIMGCSEIFYFFSDLHRFYTSNRKSIPQISMQVVQKDIKNIDRYIYELYNEEVVQMYWLSNIIHQKGQLKVS